MGYKILNLKIFIFYMDGRILTF